MLRIAEDIEKYFIFSEGQMSVTGLIPLGEERL